jgi:hypothetical protein
MPKIRCTLPNASTMISGIKFESIGGAMVSVDALTPAQIERFSSIKGYEIIHDDDQSLLDLIDGDPEGDPEGEPEGDSDLQTKKSETGRRSSKKKP